MSVAERAPGLAPGVLGRLTAGKWIVNIALRWVPPFLPTLERAFGASTTQLTTILGAGEMAGLSTVAVGPQLDRGRERTVITLGIAVVAIASLVALVGTTFTFAIGTVLVILGVANVTVAGHTFIGRRVDYHRRARAIGLFETSWALALLVGAPTIAVLIHLFGWRGPYVVLAIAATGAAIVIARTAALSTPPTSEAESGVEAGAGPTDVAPGGLSGIFAAMTPRAWLVVVGSALIAMCGLSIFAISGSWLDDAFGVPTGGLGAVAMGFGAVELASSIASATFADRLGKLRSTVGALLLTLVGAAVMSASGSTLWIGVVGILVFLCGFEFAIVTSFSLVSEVRPSARGATIALSNGVGTVARGVGTIVGGWLYGIHGVDGTLAMSATAGALAALLLFVSGRLPRHDAG